MTMERPEQSDDAGEGIIPLDVPVPPQLAEAVGYRGGARYVAFHWSSGDDVWHDDGRSAGTGNGWAWLAYVRHRMVAAHLAPYNLGYSDFDADHAVIIDREHDLASVAPIATARAFVKQQHPPPPELTPYEREEMRRALEEAISQGWREVRVDPEVVRRAMEEQRRRMAEILAYLDRWPHDEKA